MCKILIWQKFHNFTDEATEYPIGDGFSCMNFLGLGPGDSIPDSNTLWDFREHLDKNDRDGVGHLFLHFEKQLSHQGLIAREGSMVDASFVDAPRQRNTREENHEIKKGNIPERIDRNPYVKRQKDLDGRWTKKNQETHYGYKNHANGDLKTKRIMNDKSPSAHVHDAQVWQDLLDERDQVLLADSAYESQESEAYLIKEGDGEHLIQYRSYRNGALTQEQQYKNRSPSRMRVRVEHIFARMNPYGLDGFKANQHIGRSHLTYNLERYASLQGNG